MKNFLKTLGKIFLRATVDFGKNWQKNVGAILLFALIFFGNSVLNFANFSAAQFFKTRAENLPIAVFLHSESDENEVENFLKLLRENEKSGAIRKFEIISAQKIWSDFAAENPVETGFFWAQNLQNPFGAAVKIFPAAGSFSNLAQFLTAEKFAKIVQKTFPDSADEIKITGRFAQFCNFAKQFFLFLIGFFALGFAILFFKFWRCEVFRQKEKIAVAKKNVAAPWKIRLFFAIENFYLFLGGIIFGKFFSQIWQNWIVKKVPFFAGSVNFTANLEIYFTTFCAICAGVILEKILWENEN